MTSKGQNEWTHRLGHVEDDRHDPLRVGRLGLQGLPVLGAPHAGQHQEAALICEVQRRVPADAWVVGLDGLVGGDRGASSEHTWILYTQMLCTAPSTELIGISNRRYIGTHQ